MSYLAAVSFSRESAAEDVSEKAETRSTQTTDSSRSQQKPIADLFSQSAGTQTYEPGDVSIEDQESESYDPTSPSDYIQQAQVGFQTSAPEEEKEVITPIPDADKTTPEGAIRPRPKLDITINSAAMLIAYDVCIYLNMQVNTTTGQTILNQLASYVENVLVRYCGVDVTQIANKSTRSLAEFIYEEVFHYTQNPSIIGVIENTIDEVKSQVVAYVQEVAEYEEQQVQYDGGGQTGDGVVWTGWEDMSTGGGGGGGDQVIVDFDGGHPGPGGDYYPPPEIWPEADPFAAQQQELPWKTIAIVVGALLLLKK